MEIKPKNLSFKSDEVELRFNEVENKIQIINWKMDKQAEMLKDDFLNIFQIAMLDVGVGPEDITVSMFESFAETLGKDEDFMNGKKK